MKKIKSTIGLFALCAVFSVLIASCEKDPEKGVYSVADGEWESPDFLIHNAVTDIDGNSYDAVQLGNQIWMAQNLRTTRYADGTSISNIAGAYYAGSLPAAYGYLYNWQAVVRDESNIADNQYLQGICPDGWHVPSVAEWMQLIEYIGGQKHYTCNGNPEYIAKAMAGQDGWADSDVKYSVGWCPEVNNATGFSALPAGRNTGSASGYFGQQEYAFFWASPSARTIYPYVYKIHCSFPSVEHGPAGLTDAFSVRCLRIDSTGGSGGGETGPVLPTVITNLVSAVFATTATGGGEVVSDGGASVTSRGVCWSTAVAPTISGSHTSDGTGTGIFTSNLTGLSAGTAYHVRAYATNSVGTAYGNEIVFTTPAPDGEGCMGATTVTDIDGNTYNTVQIGSQCWMKENLRTTQYADGTPIEQGTGNSSFVPYWYYSNNNPSTKNEYGLLYNWRAVVRNSGSSNSNPSGIQGICPDGWHVPSDAEWTQLTDYVSSRPEYVCGYNYTHIAKALAATTRWNYNNMYACAIGNEIELNNATGFSALPAGYYYDEIYPCFGSEAWITSATAGGNYNDGQWIRRMFHTSPFVQASLHYKDVACSVRCVRDPASNR